MEAQYRRSAQKYIQLFEQLDRKSDKHSQWIEMKASAMEFPEAESHWKHVGSALRESIRKIVQSFRTAIADYLHDYGRNLNLDAWSDGGGEPSGASNELDDYIEINGRNQ